MGDLRGPAHGVASQTGHLFGPGGPFESMRGGPAGERLRPFGNTQEPRIPGTPDTGYRKMTGLSNPFLGSISELLSRKPLKFSGDPAGIPDALRPIPGAFGSSGPWGPVDTGAKKGGGGGGDSFTGPTPGMPPQNPFGVTDPSGGTPGNAGGPGDSFGADPGGSGATSGSGGAPADSGGGGGQPGPGPGQQGPGRDAGGATMAAMINQLLTLLAPKGVT
mgnify:CR=1 FL=1